MEEAARLNLLAILIERAAAHAYFGRCILQIEALEDGLAVGVDLVCPIVNNGPLSELFYDHIYFTQAGPVRAEDGEIAVVVDHDTLLELLLVECEQFDHVLVEPLQIRRLQARKVIFANITYGWLGQKHE